MMQQERPWLYLSDLITPVRHRNMMVLARRHPSLERRLSPFFSSERVRAQVSDNWVMVETCLESSWMTVMRGESTVDDVRTVAANIATAMQGGRDLVLALGCGSGLWMTPLSEFLAPDQTLRRAIVVVEPIKELMLLALSLNDLTHVLESHRVFWCVGLDWQRQLQRLLVDEGLAAASQAYACRTCPSADERYTGLLSAFADVTGEAQETYRRKVSESVARLAHAYDERDRTVKPSTSYVIAHRQGYATRFVLEGLSDGLREEGVETHVRCVEPGRFYAPETPLFDLDKHRPELVICANHPFSRYAGPSARDLAVPQIIWMTDPPVHELADPRLGEMDVAACFDPGYISELEERWNRRVLELPTAANLLIEAEPRPHLSCDVCLVGSIRPTAPILEPLEAIDRNWVEETCEALLAQRGMDLVQTINDRPPPGALAERGAAPIANLVVTIANSRHRVRCVTALEGMVVRLYGTEAWLAELPEGSQLREAYHGFVDSSEELAAIYRSSRIVLAPHGLLSRCGLTMACWNGLAQEACVLTDHLLGIDRYFVPGEEIAVFDAVMSIRETAQRLIDDDGLRQGIAEAGRQRVFRDHTFKKRAQSLLEHIALRDEGQT